MRWSWFNRHPAPAALIDLLEGRGRRAVRRHLEGCHPCANRLAALATVRDQASRDAVPEPPAVFWTQLSARISSEVLRLDRPAQAALSRWRGRLVPVGAAAAIVGVLAFVGLVRHAPAPVAPPAVAEPRAASIEPSGAAGSRESAGSDSGEPGGSWAVVLTLVEELDLADASAIGLGATPGSCDDAMAWLSEDERSELVRLIREELGGVE